MERSDIRTVPDPAAAALPRFESVMREAVAARGRFVVVLAGGSTPQPLYRALAERPDLPWRETWVVWGDERHVAPDDERRNERAAREALLEHVPVPEDQILAWPWREGSSATWAAEGYAAALRRELGDPPRFDLSLLGLGDDAHTASLFPGTGAVGAAGTTVALPPTDDREARVSLTAGALSRSLDVLFLVAGEAKRDALEGTLAGTGDHDRFPARAVSAQRTLRVLTDLALDDNGAE